MALKFPPPPRMATAELQQLNRWLLEIQSILNSSGTIDPTTVDGLIALTNQVNTNTTNIGTNTTNIATINGEITTINGEITTINTSIATLQARPLIRNGAGAPASGLGSNGDLYINNTGAVGSYLYGKIAGAWVAFA